ncbi:hypothetical protein [Thermohalobacter berrensis]|uniref:Uncharacterized protein n=1 Tax=Thermohalobacter berrensis TaxID=99594 RepID=A0A419TB59_9FIRM|nr:hypothetical protein [Thermohalobacter berrensis]RKD34695.1 hypothetical protein BET03_02395 [Thermohalobacter berrensis]
MKNILSWAVVLSFILLFLAGISHVFVIIGLTLGIISVVGLIIILIIERIKDREKEDEEDIDKY